MADSGEASEAKADDVEDSLSKPPKPAVLGAELAKKRLQSFCQQKMQSSAAGNSLSSPTKSILAVAKTNPLEDLEKAKSTTKKPKKEANTYERTRAAILGLVELRQEQERKAALVKMGVPLGLLPSSIESLGLTPKPMPTKAMPPIKNFLDPKDVEKIISKVSSGDLSSDFKLPLKSTATPDNFPKSRHNSRNYNDNYERNRWRFSNDRRNAPVNRRGDYRSGSDRRVDRDRTNSHSKSNDRERGKDRSKDRERSRHNDDEDRHRRDRDRRHDKERSNDRRRSKDTERSKEKTESKEKDRSKDGDKLKIPNISDDKDELCEPKVDVAPKSIDDGIKIQSNYEPIESIEHDEKPLPKSFVEENHQKLSSDSIRISYSSDALDQIPLPVSAPRSNTKEFIDMFSMDEPDEEDAYDAKARISSPEPNDETSGSEAKLPGNRNASPPPIGGFNYMGDIDSAENRCDRFADFILEGDDMSQSSAESEKRVQGFSKPDFSFENSNASEKASVSSRDKSDSIWETIMRSCRPMVHQSSECYRSTSSIPTVEFCENPKFWRCKCVENILAEKEKLSFNVNHIRDQFRSLNMDEDTTMDSRKWYPRETDVFKPPLLIDFASNWEMDDSPIQLPHYSNSSRSSKLSYESKTFDSDSLSKSSNFDFKYGSLDASSEIKIKESSISSSNSLGDKNCVSPKTAPDASLDSEYEKFMEAVAPEIGDEVQSEKSSSPKRSILGMETDVSQERRESFLLNLSTCNKDSAINQEESQIRTTENDSFVSQWSPKVDHVDKNNTDAITSSPKPCQTRKGHAKISSRRSKGKAKKKSKTKSKNSDSDESTSASSRSDSSSDSNTSNSSSSSSSSSDYSISDDESLLSSSNSSSSSSSSSSDSSTSSDDSSSSSDSSSTSLSKKKKKKEASKKKKYRKMSKSKRKKMKILAKAKEIARKLREKRKKKKKNKEKGAKQEVNDSLESGDVVATLSETDAKTKKRKLQSKDKYNKKKRSDSGSSTSTSSESKRRKKRPHEISEYSSESDDSSSNSSSRSSSSRKNKKKDKKVHDEQESFNTETLLCIKKEKLSDEDELVKTSVEGSNKPTSIGFRQEIISASELQNDFLQGKSTVTLSPDVAIKTETSKLDKTLENNLSDKSPRLLSSSVNSAEIKPEVSSNTDAKMKPQCKIEVKDSSKRYEAPHHRESTSSVEYSDWNWKSEVVSVNEDKYSYWDSPKSSKVNNSILIEIPIKSNDDLIENGAIDCQSEYYHGHDDAKGNNEVYQIPTIDSRNSLQQQPGYADHEEMYEAEYDSYSKEHIDHENLRDLSFSSRKISLDDRINLVLQHPAAIMPDEPAAMSPNNLVRIDINLNVYPEKGILISGPARSLRADPRLNRAKHVSYADGFAPGQDSDCEADANTVDVKIQINKKRLRVKQRSSGGHSYPCPESWPDYHPRWDKLPPPPPPPGSPPPDLCESSSKPHISPIPEHISPVLPNIENLLA